MKQEQRTYTYKTNLTRFPYKQTNDWCRYS